MKQITQNLKTGKSIVVDVPLHKLKAGHVLLQTKTSLISAGTERMLVDFGKSSYLKKAKQQPDKVKEVIQKVKTDGLMTTYEAVKAKLDQPMPMGYCNVGRVVAVGAGVEGYEIGDLVASNGQHAEYVCVPKNLCAKVPDSVSAEQACFTVLASIALQSVRLIKPELGETVVVSGLGMVGLLAVQLLRSHGCHVIGLDFNGERLRLAQSYGADVVDLSNVDDPVSIVESMIKQAGVDGVLIAAATKSNDPVSQAAKICRQRGRIVLVGVAGLELSRADFYEKELSFQVSCSYGPGRYDDDYEQKGQDYPFGFVRWTEQRNFQAVLAEMKAARLSVSELVTHQYAIDDAEKAYDTLQNDKSALGILLSYPNVELPSISQQKLMSTVGLENSQHDGAEVTDCLNVSIIGAGNYASRVLIPAFKQMNVSLDTVYTNTGLSCQIVAKKNNFKKASTDLSQLWDKSDSNLVVIATRHNTHANFVCKALATNKHVFVEKPLALDMDELEKIENSYAAGDGKYKVMVGFNRRFSSYVQKMKELLLKNAMPMSINMTINAGYIPKDHWTQDAEVGGGRIVGEACHFIDLARYLTGHTITHSAIAYQEDTTDNCHDTAIITLQFTDGSIANINYFANGHKSIMKERIEVFSKGKALQLDNFRKLTGYGWKGFKKMSSFKQDKGQDACVKAFVESIKNGSQSPISFNELIEVAQVTIGLVNQ
jgi:predicted dehydrogenase/threonine dehydrogenase-like Zn-dependent dehydrogenase